MDRNPTVPSDISAGVAAPSSASVLQKYEDERKKRLRPDGTAQYFELWKSDKYQYLREDPWVDHAALNAQTPCLKDGDQCKFLMLGAGYGGLCFAARLAEAGFSPEDIRLVDSAGGFGGTWYWNRYPGLMCDIESYIYMPLLEETGYMPKHKYSYGPELREHAERIATKWDLKDKALFRTDVKSQEWDESEKVWIVNMTESRGPGQQPRNLTVRAHFVFMASGILSVPQVPKFPGLDDFQGHMFHTSRWDYTYTGGSPKDPSLTGLKDKRVGIIGTGATAIQIVPQLAKWAKQLHVFQRTPSAVEVRGQRPTDPEQWTSEIASQKGWQRARAENFNSYTSDVPSGANLVGDGWTTLETYGTLIGTPGIIPPEKIAEYMAALSEKDLPRAERLRARVDEIVKDKATAQRLKAWYPTWCKRPTFHDDYLPTFNRENVTLVDTDGKGVQRLTEDGVVVDGTEYKVDVLILSTGYRSPAAGTGSPASRSSISIKGRNGLSLDDSWIANGAASLHGLLAHDFPNLFFSGPSQSGVSANFTYTLDSLAKHMTYVLTQAIQRAGTDKIVIEPTKEAEEAWSMEILMRTGRVAVLAGCTPSYLNKESEGMGGTDMAEMMKAGRAAIWGEGMNDYVKIVEQWRKEGEMKGIEITT